MFAAAGIVVTEMSTPISAPDFDVLSESIPAAPANRPIATAYQSGEAIVLARPWSASVKVSGPRPTSLASTVRPSVTRMPSGKPTASAVKERTASAGRRCTAATQKPAIGPNSGPTTIAPTIRIALSRITPIEAITVAMTMKARKLADSSADSDVRSVSSSHTTASAGEPTAARSAAIAASDITVSIWSTAIEPLWCRPSRRRSASTTLASSRATSARITSPSGLRAAAGSLMTLMTEAQASKSARTASACSGGVTIRRWTTQRGYAIARAAPHASFVAASRLGSGLPMRFGQAARAADGHARHSVRRAP